MKFATAAVMSLLFAEQTAAFVPFSPVKTTYKTTSTSGLSMALDTPPAASAETPNVPVIQRNQYGPTDVRYSDFLKLVDKDKIEKVTFSADGTQLLGVDVDGTRLKIESLPNDPDLLTQLTNHKVRHSTRTCQECGRMPQVGNSTILRFLSLSLFSTLF
jgi:ATP-dependent Zn protease